ncbi:MAG: hypothetical protein OXM61_19325 [Candidatus Poribacteria bacterium]|nr:hypothetical protein [Candidatus Poribacteria bacterium]
MPKGIHTRGTPTGVHTVDFLIWIPDFFKTNNLKVDAALYLRLANSVKNYYAGTPYKEPILSYRTPLRFSKLAVKPSV